MNLDDVKVGLSQTGWRDLGAGSYLGTSFDLIGSRQFLLTKWKVLVKSLPFLDRVTFLGWKSDFERMSKDSKSLIWGKCFLLCLLADDVRDDLPREELGDGFGFLGVVRVRGGGGNVLIVDKKNRKVYGKVPALPLDVHIYSKEVKEILSKGLAQ